MLVNIKKNNKKQTTKLRLNSSYILDGIQKQCNAFKYHFQIMDYFQSKFLC